MKKFLTIAIASTFATLLSACSTNPNPTYVQQQPVAYAQPVDQYPDPNQYYNDPTYANQPPVQYSYNGQQMLIDAALMAYLYNNHINPYTYYTSHPNYSHFHVYRNGAYSGFARGYRNYTPVARYHYTAPNPRYVTKSGSLDRRYNVNKVRPAASYNRPVTTAPVRVATSATYNRPVTSSPRTYNLSKPAIAPVQRSAPRTFNLSKPSYTPSRSYSSPSRSSSRSSSRSRH